MEDRYKRKLVLLELCEKAGSICERVFTSRPNATERMSRFIVVRLPQGIRPYSDTHSTAYVQFNCFVRDRQGGIENVDVMEEMLQGVLALLPFDDKLMSTIDAPTVLSAKSDGMDFHSTIIQFKIIIKL